MRAEGERRMAEPGAITVAWAAADQTAAVLALLP